LVTGAIVHHRVGAGYIARIIAILGSMASPTVLSDQRLSRRRQPVG